MIAEAFAYAILVALLVGLGAASTERVLAEIKRPRRLAWLGAYLVALAFPLLSMLLAADAPAPLAARLDVTSREATPPTPRSTGIRCCSRYGRQLRRCCCSSIRLRSCASRSSPGAGRARRAKRRRSWSPMTSGPRCSESSVRASCCRAGSWMRRLRFAAPSWPTSSSTSPLATRRSSWRLSSSRFCCRGTCRCGGSRGGCARPSRSTATRASCAEASIRRTTPTCCSPSANVVRHHRTSPQRSSSP